MWMKDEKAAILQTTKDLYRRYGDKMTLSDIADEMHETDAGAHSALDRWHMIELHDKQFKYDVWAIAAWLYLYYKYTWHPNNRRVIQLRKQIYKARRMK